MNKNLKKVISAVAALALSVSSFAALTVSAANYPDVPADADYAHAVDELTALGVVVGDDNGNFLPDKEVTRAEFAAMLVGALGPAKVQMAASASTQTTRFPDVNDVGTGKMHWASGYITALAGDGTISGFDDGKFHPDEAVSYVQAMKMLVCSAGYDTWAVDRGGWETGYLSMANEIGIGDGVQVTGNSAALTRAQCAKMVANTIKAPVLQETGEKNWDGTPVLSQKNKTGRNWQSILTKNHDAYVVYGRVTETSKTASGGMDADEVRFQVERATNFEDEYYTRNDDPVEIIANVGDTDAANQLRVYSEAIVRVNAYDEYELICLQPLSSNAEVTFAAADFDDENSAYRGAESAGVGVESTGRIYASLNGSSKTTSYRLATEDGQFTGSYYVNGVDMSNTGLSFADFVNEYIVDNNVGDVTLVSESSTGSTATSGDYNTIMVTYYQDAIVDSVDADDQEAEIVFLNFEEDLDESLVIDYEDEDVDVSIVKSGAKINAADINPYDVVSIAWDVTVNFGQSSFYDVIVSDKETKEGKGTVRTKDGVTEYQLDGDYYKVVDGLVGSNLDRQTTFVWYFDNFGRIAYTEEVSSDKNLAIIDNIYPSIDGETMNVKLIYKDGTSGTVSLSTKLNNATTIKTISGYIFNNGNEDDGKKEPQERVVEYRVNGSNELTEVKAPLSYRTANGEYSASSNKIGQYRFSEATATLVMSEDGSKWEIKYLDPTTLYDGDDYIAYFYDRSTSGTYALAIVRDTSGGWSKSTQMAAFVSTVTTSSDDYEYELEMYTADVEKSTDVTRLYLSDDYIPYQVMENGELKNTPYTVTYADLENNRLSEGTPVLYTTDSAGAVTSIRTVFSRNEDGFLSATGFDDFKNFALVDDLSTLVDTTFKSDANAQSDEQYKLVFGLVSDKSGGQVDFVTKFVYDDKLGSYTAKTVNDNDTEDSVESYGLSDQTTVYVFDYNGSSKYGDLITEGGMGSVRATAFNNNSWIKDSDDTVAIMNNVKKPQYAVARILDEEIMEIMVFVPEK